MMIEGPRFYFESICDASGKRVSNEFEFSEAADEFYRLTGFDPRERPFLLALNKLETTVALRGVIQKNIVTLHCAFADAVSRATGAKVIFIPFSTSSENREPVLRFREKDHFVNRGLDSLVDEGSLLNSPKRITAYFQVAICLISKEIGD